MQRSTTVPVVGVLLVAAVGALFVAGAAPGPGPDAGDDVDNGTDFQQFESSAAFEEYVERSRQLSRGGTVWLGQRARFAGGVEFELDAAGDDAAESATVSEGQPTAGDGASAAGPRFSGTNVQETGVDEPDVLKTDGEHAYYTQDPHPRRGEWAGDGTKVVDLRPAGTAEEVGELGHSGDLLRLNDTLVVFDDDAIYGYDVSDPENPERTWRTDRESPVVSARLYDGTVYVVFASDLRENPCPVTPVGDDVVRCTDVHHPGRPVPVDVTYTAAALDPDDGEVTDSTSFVGSRDATVYMSGDGLYVTYTEGTDRAEVAMEFLLSEGDALLDGDAVDRLERLQSYDLSAQATYAEIEAILRDHQAGMDDRERKEFHETLGERYAEWADERRGEFTRTHVVKIGVGQGLDPEATGTVPGTPLNQWSLDAHEGHLRVATTVQPPRLWGDVNSTNDVHVLDGNLSTVGSVTGMGETERVYSVRFTGDTGYVVTFRRIDPFHVLDLSDPENPTLEGELKLPGFSTYLHPLSDGQVLGLGEEDGKVKAVVFDVSDPTDPTVLDDAVLADEWSAIRESHHAFLLDRRHGVFFLPGNRGGHVFSYEDGLEEVYTVDVNDPQRAMYLDDYLYVFSQNEVVVVDETNWQEVDRLELA